MKKADKGGKKKRGMRNLIHHSRGRSSAAAIPSSHVETPDGAKDFRWGRWWKGVQRMLGGRTCTPAPEKKCDDTIG